MQKKHLNFVVLIDLALKVMTKCLRNIVGSGPTTCQTDTEMFQAENLRKIKKKKKEGTAAWLRHGIQGDDSPDDRQLIGKLQSTRSIHLRSLEPLRALGIVRSRLLTRAGCGPATISFPPIREWFLQTPAETPAAPLCYLQPLSQRLHPSCFCCGLSLGVTGIPPLGKHTSPFPRRVPPPEPALPAPLRDPNMGSAHPDSPAQARTGARCRGVTQGPGSSPGPGER